MFNIQFFKDKIIKVNKKEKWQKFDPPPWGFEPRTRPRFEF
jgi:hypothetical protein